MNNIKLTVAPTDDKAAVVIGAQTSSAGDTEDRAYHLDPVMAVDFANSMLHAAEDCGVVVQMQTLGISDEKRMRLIRRTELMMRSMAGRKPFYVAAQVVDKILSEVL
jgi:hypothetical protein